MSGKALSQCQVGWICISTKKKDKITHVLMLQSYASQSRTVSCPASWGFFFSTFEAYLIFKGQNELIKRIEYSLDLISFLLVFQNFSTDHDEFSNSVKYDCFSNSIAISLTKNRLSNFNHALFHLNNESCTGQQINTTHIRLQTELNDCGTLKQILGNGSVIYTNRVYGYIKGQKNKPGSASKTYKVKCVKPHNASERNVSTLKYDSVVPNFSTQDSTLFQVGHHHKAFSLQQRNGKFCPRRLH